MQLDEVLRRRRMVRRFTDEPVGAADVARLVDAALRAPSAGFTQGCHFLVLETAEDRARLWATSDFVPATPALAERSARIQAAPLLIVPLCSKRAYLERYAEPDKTFVAAGEGDWAIPYWYVDAAFASMLVLLEAVDLGLGALFLAVSPGTIPTFRAEFAVPGDFEPIGVILVGHRHPEVGPSRRLDRRKPAGAVVSSGDFGRPYIRPSGGDAGPGRR